jgi:HEPN domain-containing protein
MNRPAAVEWLRKSYHDLTSAQILYEAHHYIDSIGVDLHYAIEKLFKAFLAYDNVKIPKTHNLPELYEGISDHIRIEDDTLLYVANRYHIEVSYPLYERSLPSREEIKEVLDFTEKFFDEVLSALDIDKADIL